MAPRIPTRRVVAGRTLSDPYAWLRDRDDPQVLAYLEAENRYTERMTAHTAALRETLYQEMVGRIRETDLSVPYRRGDFYYYSRTEQGLQYPLYCRKRGSLAGREEVMLDLNALAEGHGYFRLGSLEVSPDGRLLAYASDTDGSEHFTVRIKNLDSGETYPDVITGTDRDLAWADDNRTLFYITLDDTNRPYRLWRHTLGSRAADDTLAYQEDDKAFFAAIEESRSRRFLLLTLESATTTEVRFLAADDPGGDFRLLAPRQQGVMLQVAHHGDHFYVRSNEGAKDFRLLRAPVAAVQRERWEEVIPERPGITLSGVEAFAGHLVLLERREGLLRIRIRALPGG